MKSKTKIVSINKSMETFKNIIRSYKQKFANVADEIYKVSLQNVTLSIQSQQILRGTFYYYSHLYNIKSRILINKIIFFYSY